MTLDETLLKEEIRASCYCGLPAEDCKDGDIMVCPSCGVHSHRDCWDYLADGDGRGCYIMGCKLQASALKDLDDFGIPLVTIKDVSSFVGAVNLGLSPVDRSRLSRFERGQAWLRSVLVEKFGWRKDVDGWIDDYLADVRRAYGGLSFVNSDRWLSLSKGVSFCREKGGMLVSAAQEALARVLIDSRSLYYQVSRTCVLGFVYGCGNSMVAYDDIADDRLNIVLAADSNWKNSLHADDSLVLGALGRAYKSGRVVPLRGSRVLSLRPDASGQSEASLDDGVIAFFGSVALPYCLWLYRRLGKIDLRYYVFDSQQLSNLNGKVFVRPLGLSVNEGYLRVDYVAADESYFVGGRSRACSVGAKNLQLK